MTLKTNLPESFEINMGKYGYTGLELSVQSELMVMGLKEESLPSISFYDPKSGVMHLDNEQVFSDIYELFKYLSQTSINNMNELNDYAERTGLPKSSLVGLVGTCDADGAGGFKFYANDTNMTHMMIEISVPADSDVKDIVLFRDVSKVLYQQTRKNYMTTSYFAIMEFNPKILEQVEVLR